MADPLANFTPQQRDGVTATGQSLLLSAAAGSGKTAVLSQRCVHLVCRASPACEIDESLVVAFNDAAAMEMKARIQSQLENELIARPTDRLRRQLALVDHASISTLHGFCLRLIKQHFQRVGLDPNFTTIDADDAFLLRSDVVRELFDRHYEDDSDASFRTLINHYGNGDDAAIIKNVLHLSAMLDGVLDPHAWCEQAKARLTQAAGEPLAHSEIGQSFCEMIARDVHSVLTQIDEALAFISPRAGVHKYLPVLKDWRAIVATWPALLQAETFDDFSAEIRSHVAGMFDGKLPSIPSAVPDKEAAQKRMTRIRDALRGGFVASAVTVNEARWRETIARTQPAAKMLLELVLAFRAAYAEAKSRLRMIDFADQERLALTILSDPASPIGTTPSDVALSLQRRFKHVMVDEYQDINEVQDAVLRLVSRESAPADAELSPNLFTVGDVKQSIYRFRLAEPRRFLDRMARFRADTNGRGRVIDLQENFRSRAPLLVAINAIFRRLMTAETADIDYDATQELKPGAQYPPLQTDEFNGAPIELHVLPKGLAAKASVDNSEGESANEADEDFEQEEYEATIIAQRIRALLGMDGSPIARVMQRGENNQLISRDARLSDIVILLRSQVFAADQYANVLRTWGIAAHSESTAGLFARQEIRDLLALLAVLDNPQQDIPLAAVLRSPILRPGTSEDDLATVRLAYSADGDRVPFYRAVTQFTASQHDAIALRLREKIAQLDVWRARMQREPVADVLRSIYDDTGLLAYYRGLPEGEQRCANLEDLYRRASQFGTFAKQGLSRFRSFLDRLEREGETGQAALDATGDAVRIMTIHKSKGLEWPIVFVARLGRGFNQLDAQGMILSERRAGVALHEVDEVRQLHFPSMASHVLKNAIQQQLTAEEIRTLYVALTRAREKLILVGSVKTGVVQAAMQTLAGHAGPLPRAVVQSAGSPMEWLIDIAAAGEDNAIEVIEHDAEQVKATARSMDAGQDGNDRLQLLATLQPLPAMEIQRPDLLAAEERATAALDRIAFVYPHTAATQHPAVRSVTAWSKQGATAVADLDRSPIEVEIAAEASPADKNALDQPTFLSADAPFKATDVGTNTHVALEHYEYENTSDPVAKQIEKLIARGLLTRAQAAVIDGRAIEWFLSSEVGELFVRAGEKLHRELPVYLPADASIAGETLMLRGRLDAFVEDQAGDVVVDYKTDRVRGDALIARADFYAGQLRTYADAMSRITGRPVRAAYLIFLHARQIIDVMEKK